jgi:pantoate--beta-alanine ligase
MSLDLLRMTEELLKRRQELNRAPGVVMTMGNLHSGHLSLVEQSLKNHESTIVTIFVNPKQFGPNEDFERYPRTLELDLELLTKLKSSYKKRSLWVFAPASPQDIYPPGFSTSVKVRAMTDILCGAARPTHFEGVTTVVARLLNLTQPHTAYFGQKDYQQVQVIKQMVGDLAMPYTIAMVPIVRDHDGLALSSRNQYLSAEQRKRALKLPRLLSVIETELKKSPTPWEFKLGEYLQQQGDDSFEYLELLDAHSLQAPSAQSSELVLLGALKVGQTRLIDNRLIPLQRGRA